MKAIVVVFVRMPDALMPVARLAAMPTVKSLRQCGDLSVRLKNRSAKSPSCDESMPPFWTWFIENPRGSAT